VNLKIDEPTIDEKVADVVSTGVGTVVGYTVSATVPSTAGYSSYTYRINDQLSAGLTFTGQYTVSVVKGSAASAALPTAAYSFSATQAGGDVLVWDFSDLVTNTALDAGDVIVLTYTAEVNESAVSGVAGNPNSATVTYSNDPGEDSSTDTSTEVEDTVYLGSLTVNKVDLEATGTKLAGATFRLVGGSYDRILTTGDGSGTSTLGVVTFGQLPAGEYTLTETVAPDGYFALPASVKVTVAVTEEGVFTYTLDRSGNQDKYFPLANGTSLDAPFQFDDGLGVLTIGDGQGITNVPFTGGQGVAAAVVAAVLIGGVAFVVARRGRKIEAEV
jgi:fimbrial isopeptide formation D2 family protein